MISVYYHQYYIKAPKSVWQYVCLAVCLFRYLSTSLSVCLSRSSIQASPQKISTNPLRDLETKWRAFQSLKYRTLRIKTEHCVCINCQTNLAECFPTLTDLLKQNKWRISNISRLLEVVEQE